MKVTLPQGSYHVSFNTEIFGYELGEGETVDFVGDDIDELAQEVIADDTGFPMFFRKSTDEGRAEGLVGEFVSVDDDYVCAIMYEK
jgi:hypothetical protein